MESVGKCSAVVPAAAAAVKWLEQSELLPTPTEMFIRPVLTKLETHFVQHVLSQPSDKYSPLLPNLERFHCIQSVIGDSEVHNRLFQKDDKSETSNKNNAAIPLLRIKLSPDSCMKLTSGSDLLHQAVFESLLSERNHCLGQYFKMLRHFGPNSNDNIAHYPPFTLWIDIEHGRQWYQCDSECEENAIERLGDIVDQVIKLAHFSSTEQMGSYVLLHSSGLFSWRRVVSDRQPKHELETELSSPNTLKKSSIFVLDHIPRTPEEADELLLECWKELRVGGDGVNVELHPQVKEMIGRLSGWRRGLVYEICLNSMPFLEGISSQEGEKEEEDMGMDEDSFANSSRKDHETPLVSLSVPLAKGCAQFERVHTHALKEDILCNLSIAERIALWRLLECICVIQPSIEERLHQDSVQEVHRTPKLKPLDDTGRSHLTDMKEALMVLGAGSGDEQSVQIDSTKHAIHMLKKLMFLGYIEAVPMSTTELPLVKSVTNDSLLDVGEGENFQLSVPPPVAQAFILLNQDKSSLFLHQIEVLQRWEELVEDRKSVDKDTLQLINSWNDYYTDRCELEQKKTMKNEDFTSRELSLVHRELSMLQKCSTLHMRREAFRSAVEVWKKLKLEVYPDLEDVEEKLVFENDITGEKLVRKHVLSMMESRHLAQEAKQTTSTGSGWRWRFWK